MYCILNSSVCIWERKSESEKVSIVMHSQFYAVIQVQSRIWSQAKYTPLFSPSFVCLLNCCHVVSVVVFFLLVFGRWIIVFINIKTSNIFEQNEKNGWLVSFCCCCMFACHKPRFICAVFDLVFLLRFTVFSESIDRDLKLYEKSKEKRRKQTKPVHLKKATTTKKINRLLEIDINRRQNTSHFLIRCFTIASIWN